MYFSPTLDGFVNYLDYRPWCATKTDEFHNAIPFDPANGKILPDQDGAFNIGIVEDSDSCPHNGKHKYLKISIIFWITFFKGYIQKQCGVPIDTRNEDNSVATISQFPWTVSVGGTSNSGSWEHLCDGTLISDSHVLTLASCLKEKVEAKDGLELAFGASKLAQDSLIKR